MKVDLKKIVSKILPCLTYGVFSISFFLSAYILWTGLEGFYIDGKTFQSDRGQIGYIIDSLIFPAIPTFFSLILPLLLFKKRMQAFALFSALACFFLFAISIIPALEATVGVSGMG